MKTVDSSVNESVSRKGRACNWEDKVASDFLLPLQSNAGQGQRVICYCVEQLWANHGGNSNSLESR